MCTHTHIRMYTHNLFIPYMQVAARKAISQVVFSRIVMAGPSMSK